MAASSSALLSGLNVLLIEDETTISFLIEDMLSELGATSVQHGSSVDAGLKLLSEGPFAAAVLDVNLGGQLVYPLAERLEAQNIPFVFITGYGRGGVSERWASHEVIQKPLMLAELEQALRVVLQHARPLINPD